jgi:ornithine cyclodeaminase/alanine dehydrogenase
MGKVTVLNQTAIQQVLMLDQVIAGVEAAYVAKSTDKAVVWPLIFYEFNPGQADMDIKSGYLPEQGIYGLKLVSWFGGNPAKDLPALYGTTLVFDSQTGAPIGMLDAEYVTGMRTGAAGAIGAKYLARADSQELLLVGAGHQALFLVAATLMVMDNIRRVRVYDPKNPEQGAAFCRNLANRLQTDFINRYQDRPELVAQLKQKFAVECTPVTDLAEAVPGSDIVLTATPAREALIQSDWVRPGTHFSCIGADMEGKQEIDAKLLAVAKVFVDDVDQSTSVGELEIAIKSGLLTREMIAGEIGHVIDGTLPGRSSAEEITVFDSTGIALQDLICSQVALAAAKERGIGVTVEL